MSVTAIIAGARIENYDWLAKKLTSADKIFCADSGLNHANKIGIIPDKIVGDFDSVDKNLLNKYKTKSEIIHNPDQYSTDLMKALDLTNDLCDIEIYGAVGGRADHDFSNIITLLNRECCNHIILKTEHDERRVIKKPISMKADIGDMFGIFPLRPVNQLHYEGLKWPAQGLDGPFDLGWNGACNPAISTTVEIFIDSGAALVTRTYKNFVR